MYYAWARSNDWTETRVRRSDNTRLGMNSAGYMGWKVQIPPQPTHTHHNQWTDTEFQGCLSPEKDVSLTCEYSSRLTIDTFFAIESTPLWLCWSNKTQHGDSAAITSYYGPDHMGPPWYNHIWLKSSGSDNVDLFIKHEWF